MAVAPVMDGSGHEQESAFTGDQATPCKYTWLSEHHIYQVIDKICLLIYVLLIDVCFSKCAR